jgi:hypothetical protein
MLFALLVRVGEFDWEGPTQRNDESACAREPDKQPVARAKTSADWPPPPPSPAAPAGRRAAILRAITESKIVL